MHIDGNGDAAGNYTIVSRMFKNDPSSNKSVYGLFPIGVFVPGLDNNRIPVSYLPRPDLTNTTLEFMFTLSLTLHLTILYVRLSFKCR